MYIVYYNLWDCIQNDPFILLLLTNNECNEHLNGSTYIILCLITFLLEIIKYLDMFNCLILLFFNVYKYQRYTNINNYNIRSYKLNEQKIVSYLGSALMNFIIL